MTIEYLKSSKPEQDKASDNAKVASVVADTLVYIESDGDKAVRELSEKFDNYSPDSFRLSEEQIQALIAKVPERDLADIQFAHDQVVNFAKAQRDSMQDIEVETLPGVILGHKHIPVQSVGCYVPGGKFPMVASAHMSVATAKVAGVPRIVACTPPFKGEPNPAVVAAMHIGGADEIYVIGGIQAVGAMVVVPTPSTLFTCWYTRKCLCGRSQASAFRTRGHRPFCRSNRNHGDCRRYRRC